jgi:hypothetical protein
MSVGVLSVVFSSLFNVEFLSYIGYLLSCISLMFYFYIIYIIYKSRPRKENDVYALSLMFSYSSLIVTLVLWAVYFVVGKEEILLATVWLLFFGFFGFLITGHIYKIIPFLVWFERFSPLVGKERVPMLADMVPFKSSQAQMVFSAVGVILITVAILTKNDVLINAGASFLVVGAFAFFRSMLFMINFK